MAGTGPAAAAYPPLACGETVTGTVTLTADLTCTDVGLFLETGATLDLGGHTLTGPGRTAGVALETDPEMPWPGSVTVRNGTIANWGQVVGSEFDQLAAAFSDMTFRSIGAVFGGMGVRIDVDRSRFLDANGGYFWNGYVHIRDSYLRGGWIEGGPYWPDVTIERSTLESFGIGGSCTESGRITIHESQLRGTGVAAEASWCAVDLRDSTFRGFDVAVRTGMDSAHGSLVMSQVINNAFVDNGTALNLGAMTTVRGNEFTRNGVGVKSLTGADEVDVDVEDIVLDGNTFTRNGDGVLVDTLVHASNNTAVRNAGYGLYVAQAVDGGGNVAYRNGIDCVGVACAGR